MEDSNDVLQAASSVANAARKLEILCLHGFRQNSKQFRGRLAGLQKKIAHVANLTFIDAPYILPLWYKQPLSNQNPSVQPSQQLFTHHQSSHSSAATPSPKRAWLLSQDLLDSQPQLQGQCAQQETQLSQLQDAANTAGAGMMHSVAADCQAEPDVAQADVTQVDMHGRTHEQQQSGASCSCQATQGPAIWQQAPANIATLDQYTTQSCGWDRSWNVIWDALSSDRHYDGMLGFSQGAAVAGVVAALLQQQIQDSNKRETAPMSLLQQQQLKSGHEEQQTMLLKDCCSDQHLLQDTREVEPSADHQQLSPVEVLQRRKEPAMKFVILASGFMSPAQEHQELLARQTPIQLPSLHVYAGGRSNGDRQIQQQLSEALSMVFEPASRRTLMHDGGHLVPCNRGVVDQILEFLHQFA